MDCFGGVFFIGVDIGGVVAPIVECGGVVAAAMASQVSWAELRLQPRYHLERMYLLPQLGKKTAY